MTDYRTVTACRLCDSTDLTKALKLPDTPLANELWTVEETALNALPGACPYGDEDCTSCGTPEYQEKFPLVVMRCGSCGHHQLSIAVSPERLWGPDYPYQSGTSPVFRAHLEALADEVVALKPGGRVLEIGSNDGTLVKLLEERRMDAVGVDPSGPDVSGPPYQLLRAPWPCPPVFNEKADVILALNVFAHVDDLHSFTAAVKEALAPDGVFIVEVGYLADVVNRGHFDCIYHEHMSIHSLQPLGRLFQRHGLFMYNCEPIESQGGSIRCYVRHDGRTERTDYSEGKPDWEAFGYMIDSRAAALREALNKLFHRDEMVCIYGAPAKLTTLLYATGLEKMPFNCVGEDNPRKVGRTTPGMHLPIVSVADMLSRKPDTILVAAWNFFDDIRRKLRDAGFKGGIINPMGDV